MRKIALALIAVLIGTGFASARCKGKDLLRRADPAFVQHLQNATARHPFPNGRYWEVSKGGKTSWIIGTIHIEDGRTKDVPAFFRKKLRTARLLQKEITGTLGHKIRLAGSRKKARKHAPVRNYYNAEEWALIVRFASKKGIRERDLLKYSAESVRNILSSPPCSSQRDIYLDKKVELAARKVNVPVQALDSVQKRVALEYNTHFNDKYFVTMTKAFLPRLKQSVNDWETTVQMYRRGETMMIWEYRLALARQVLPSWAVKNLQRESYGMLIIDRNREWMSKILPQVTKGNVVIAVGALHLPGKHGLIYQLQQRGFAVKKLKL